MSCEQCGQGIPEIILTSVIEDEATVKHLCRKCAATQVAVDTSDGDTADHETSESPGSELRGDICPKCGLSLDEIMQTTKFGCPECYRSLGSGVETLLRRVQGALLHQGKVPGTEPGWASLKVLERRLTDAIRREAFEEAAVLRDQIIELTREGNKATP